MKYSRKIFLILLVLTPMLIIYLSPRAIKIDRIECANQYGICSEDLIDKFDMVLSINLHDTKAEIRKILQSDSTITDFSVQYKLPNILRVNVIDKDPRYAISSVNAESVAIVDSRGEIIAFTQSTNLPQVMVESRLPNVGDSIDKNTLFALKLVYGVRLSNKIADAKIENNNLFIKLEDDIKVIFPTSGDLDILLGSVNLLLSRLNVITKDTKIDEKEIFTEIDLRFKNPVVR